MADSKVSALTDGAPAQTTDNLYASRGGADRRLTVANVVALAGDVAGAASSVDSEIALFSGTGGKTIKRASTTGILKAASGVIGAAVSGTDIKTVNSTTLLGSGDIVTGDVAGQASSVDSEIALFSGTGGKTIKRATTSGILKGTSGVISAATADVDYATPTVTKFLAEDTWANRPSAATNTRKIFPCTDLGLGLALFFSDGTNWRPVNGHLLLYRACGSIASPVDSKTGGTTHQFTLPATAAIPAGLIPPNSMIMVQGHVVKTVTASAGLGIRLGTNGTSSDQAMVGFSMGATTVDQSFMTGAWFTTSTTSYSRHAYLSWQGSVTSASFGDVSTSVNTAAAMAVSFDIYTGNSSDTYKLVDYAIWLQA